MNKTKLTQKQIEVLNFIAEYQSKYGTRPTHLEIAQKMGITVGAIHFKVDSLIRRKIMYLKDIYIINAEKAS